MSTTGTIERSIRASRISAVEISDAELKRLEAECSAVLTARDQAFWEAQRAGIEIRLLASLTGLTVQAVYQGISRAKRLEKESE